MLSSNMNHFLLLYIIYMTMHEGMQQVALMLPSRYFRSPVGKVVSNFKFGESVCFFMALGTIGFKEEFV